MGFRRDAVGGMGTGMCCLAARVKALGGDCGARKRTDFVHGTDVWMRLPFDPPSGVGGDGMEGLSDFLDLGSGRLSAPPVSGQVEVFAPEDFGGPAADGPAAMSVGESPVDAPPRSDDMSSMPDAKPLAGLRILVVDDSAPIRKVMQRSLIEAGAAVETAMDGDEAVAMVKAGVRAGTEAARYDLIVTDIQVGA